MITWNPEEQRQLAKDLPKSPDPRTTTIGWPSSAIFFLILQIYFSLIYFVHMMLLLETKSFC